MRESDELSRLLADERDTRAAGAALAAALGSSGVASALVTIAGELGAGKTTLVRGLLEALGVAGPVRSPTYTLVESYEAGGRRVHHLDWYRLTGDEDLEGLGFRELHGPGQFVLVEWPERAPVAAAGADLAVSLAYEGGGRRLRAVARTERGRALLACWIQAFA
jgi:tRNA threonylcarbamoyladenosine biosynthesis protein TsaE